jgi:molybdopterin converting factor small subunit
MGLMATGTIRYWAAARAAAGTDAESYTGDTLAAVLEAARAAHGEQLARVLGHCSFLVDGARARPDTVLVDGDVVEVLPPFAGG